MKQFLAATKFSFKEQLANRFALGLLVLFVPIVYWMYGAVTPNDAVPFRFQPAGTFLSVNGHDLMYITTGLNVLALIIGFMFFHSAHKSLEFDKRLTRAGLGCLRFILAKILALAVVTAILSLYTLLILLIFWHSPHNIFVVWLSYWLISLVYGGFGLLLGMLLDSELAGFFIVIMFSQMDVFLQIPIDNPAANKTFLKFFPSYGAVQMSIAGGFTNNWAIKEALIGGSWAIVFLLIAFMIFYLRTRYRSSLKIIANN